MADGQVQNRRRTPKNVQTDHHIVPYTRRHPEEAENRLKPSVVPCHSEGTLQNQGATCQLQELRNHLEDARETLSS